MKAENSITFSKKLYAPGCSDSAGLCSWERERAQVGVAILWYFDEHKHTIISSAAWCNGKLGGITADFKHEQ